MVHLSFLQTDGVEMGRPVTPTRAEINTQAAISTTLHLQKVWEQFVADVYSILKRA